MDEKKLPETETSAPEVMDAVNAFEIVYQYKGIYRPSTDADATPAEKLEVGDIAYTDVYTAKKEEETESAAVIGTIAPAPAPAEEEPQFVYNQKLIRKNKRAAELVHTDARPRAFGVMSLICGACGVVAAVLFGYVGVLLGVFALCFRSVARQLDKGNRDVVNLIGLITGLVSIFGGIGRIALQYLA